MLKNVKIKKFTSHQAATEYNLKQALHMSAAMRIHEMENLRQIYCQMKGYEYPPRLRRTVRIIRKTSS